MQWKTFDEIDLRKYDPDGSIQRINGYIGTDPKAHYLKVFNKVYANCDSYVELCKQHLKGGM